MIVRAPESAPSTLTKPQTPKDRSMIIRCQMSQDILLTTQMGDHEQRSEFQANQLTSADIPKHRAEQHEARWQPGTFHILVSLHLTVTLCKGQAESATSWSNLSHHTKETSNLLLMGKWWAFPDLSSCECKLGAEARCINSSNSSVLPQAQVSLWPACCVKTCQGELGICIPFARDDACKTQR